MGVASKTRKAAKEIYNTTGSFDKFTKEVIAQGTQLGYIETAFSKIINEAVNTRELKDELKKFRELDYAVNVVMNVNKHTPAEVNEAHHIFNLRKEEVRKLIGQPYTESQYKAEPRLLMNMYIDYMEAKHQKEKKFFEELRFDQNNTAKYKITNKTNPSKDLINQIELKCTTDISNRIYSEWISNIKTLENRSKDLSGLTKLMVDYVDSLRLTSPSSVGKPLEINKLSEPTKAFWRRIKELDKNIKAGPEMEKNPEYLKHLGFMQIMNVPEMSELIEKELNGPDGLTEKLSKIADTFHKRGSKKEIVEFRKLLHAGMNSEDVRLFEDMLKASVKLGKKKNSIFGAALEARYDKLVQDHADFFTKKDADGYTKWQKIAAEIIASATAWQTLSNIVNLHSDGIAFEKVKSDRQKFVSELSDNASNGLIFNTYLHDRDMDELKPSKVKAEDFKRDIGILGYSDVADVLSSISLIPIQKLEQAERGDFEKSMRAIEAAKAASSQANLADAINVIKYGNKAQLLDYENLLPSKDRERTKKMLLNQFNAIGPDESYTENLAKARAALYIQMLLNGSNEDVTNAAKKALGAKAFREAKKKLLSDYMNDFEGYTVSEWNETNAILEKACEAQKDIVFI
ncbi:MAG: hypothetical protein M1465_03315 [Candidatus Marsarchaeota archaeon]|nr:hypothetical protein [Candidatus Marsarchaeota archaeon]